MRRYRLCVVVLVLAGCSSPKQQPESHDGGGEQSGHSSSDRSESGSTANLKTGTQTEGSRRPDLLAEGPMPLVGTWKFKGTGDVATATCLLRATLDGESGELKIAEEMELEFHKGRYSGKTIGRKSVVTYGSPPEFVVVGGVVNTTMDGKPGMQVSLNFESGLAQLDMVGKLDREGYIVDPPKEMSGRKKKPLPGYVLFESALPVLGPILLKEDGERKDVTVIRFPDDWFIEPSTEPIGVQTKCSLRRRSLEAGGFQVETVERFHGKEVNSATYDAEAQLIGFADNFLGVRLTIERGEIEK